MMTTPKIYLVSCVSKKRSELSAAKDLYISDWFFKARAYVEATSSPWFILSAEYGLVNPDQIVPPYERTLNTMGVAERRSWADRVCRQLELQLPNPCAVTILAGMRYREFIMDFLRRHASSVDVPLEGLRIGEQLGWFASRQ